MEKVGTQEAAEEDVTNMSGSRGAPARGRRTRIGIVGAQTIDQRHAHENEIGGNLRTGRIATGPDTLNIPEEQVGTNSYRRPVPRYPQCVKKGLHRLG